LLNNTRDVITSAITEIQTMSRAMVIPTRQDKDIAAYIGELVSDLKNTKLFHILFSSDIPRTLYIPRGKRIALYRIVQEQIKNIIKYSKAKNIQIYLGYDTHHIRLLVRDDGIGFDPSQNGKGKGIGLRNIYDRATLYNGTVELNTSPGKGCEWKVCIPVK